MGPEDFNDLWDTKWPGPKVSGNLKPRVPKDRVVGEFSTSRKSSRQILLEQERETLRVKQEKLRRRVQEEREKKYDLDRKLNKMRNLIMNVVIPVIVVLSILLSGGVFLWKSDKKPEQFQEKRTLQVQEAPKKGTPTITRSE